MPVAATLLRPRDADALRAELRLVHAQTRVPVLFGGEVFKDTLVLSEFVGTRTKGLRGLAVRPGGGLGGAAVLTKRPIAVSDYRHALNITHDYDSPVLTEGLRSLLAVPVVVEGHARAVLYSAHRRSAPIGDRLAAVLVASATKLAQEFAIRDEVDRRLRLREPQNTDRTETEEVRAVHAELRLLAADATVPLTLRRRLRDLAHTLAGAHDPFSTPTHLSARELDVLAQVALGCSNREAAQRLSLKPETVKSYLRSAAAKFGASNRHEAVTAARRARLLP